MINQLHKPKWIGLVISLEETKSVYKSSQKLLITYSYATDIKKILLDKKLITEKKQGRTNIIEFTKKGKEFLEAVKKIDALV